MEKNLDNIIAYRLRKLRKQTGLTQVELAKIMGVVQNTINGWETSRQKPSYETLIRLAMLFKVSVNYFYAKDNKTITIVKNSENEIIEKLLNDPKSKQMFLMYEKQYLESSKEYENECKKLPEHAWEIIEGEKWLPIYKATDENKCIPIKDNFAKIRKQILIKGAQVNKSIIELNKIIFNYDFERFANIDPEYFSDPDSEWLR